MHHKQIKAAMGIKIVAPDLEKAIAGSRLLVCGPDDDEEELREEVMSDMTNLFSRVDSGGRGVFVQASTLGSLEALLEFLKSDAVKIPVAGINIGPVHKKDIMRCATMLEKAPEFAVVLCFDVPVDKDAEDQAAKLGVKIFKGAPTALSLFSSRRKLTCPSRTRSRHHLPPVRPVHGVQEAERRGSSRAGCRQGRLPLPPPHSPVLRQA